MDVITSVLVIFVLLVICGTLIYIAYISKRILDKSTQNKMPLLTTLAAFSGIGTFFVKALPDVYKAISTVLHNIISGFF